MEMKKMTRSRFDRRVQALPGQLRSLDDADTGEPVIEGHFAVFDSDYPIWPGCVERVAPGAFASSLQSNDVRALCDHETRIVLGRTAAGTLTLKEDERGLFGRIAINRDDVDAMNLYARVKRGDVSQCSFGFDITDEEYIQKPDGTTMYYIRDVVLYEVSVVTFPAYEATSVEARAMDREAGRRSAMELWRKTMKEKLKCLN